MTRGELKALRSGGIELALAADLPEGMDGLEKRDQAMDRVFSLAVTAGEPDDLTPGDAVALLILIGKATYAPGETLKNLLAPQQTGSADGSATAASARKRGSKRNGAARK